MLEAIIQGAIQGLTEFLPISSSGHLSLFQYFTGQGGKTGQMFTVLLHMGTLLAVCLAFYKTILGIFAEFGLMIADMFRGRFHFRDMQPRRRMLFLLIVSLVPMALSLPLLGLYSRVSSDNDIIVEGVCFIITSILLFAGDRCVKGRKTAKDMKYRDAATIGVMQALAPFPGISRSGSTISVGLMTGLERKFAVAFSFIMGIPPVLAANLMELKDIGAGSEAVPLPVMLVGIGVAMVVGLLAIKIVSWLVSSEKFGVFAWYTMILGVLTVGLGVFEILTGHMLQGIFATLLGT